MGVTPTYALPYPELPEPADIPADIKQLAERTEVVLGGITPPLDTRLDALEAAVPANNTALDTRLDALEAPLPLGAARKKLAGVDLPGAVTLRCPFAADDSSCFLQGGVTVYNASDLAVAKAGIYTISAHYAIAGTGPSFRIMRLSYWTGTLEIDIASSGPSASYGGGSTTHMAASGVVKLQPGWRVYANAYSDTGFDDGVAGNLMLAQIA